MKKVFYVTNWYPTFWLTFYLADVHFRGELQHVDDVVSKRSNVDQSELETQLVSDCKTEIYENYISERMYGNTD